MELAPSWLVHDHSAERRWVIAEAMNRGIDPESLLRRAIGSAGSPGTGVDT